MSFWGQINLLDPASPIQAEILLFHDHALIILIGILTLVGIIGVKLCAGQYSSRVLHEAQLLETLWTILPGFLLIWLAFPRLRLLYLLDDQGRNGLILKAIGHQWYWRYEIPSLRKSAFDSYIVKEEDLKVGFYRLLEVDRAPKLPYGVDINVITTRSDVIHAWALPRMGVKMDSVPGRLNSIGFHANLPGVYYGQCSEICGANHSFIPIGVWMVSIDDFLPVAAATTNGRV